MRVSIAAWVIALGAHFVLGGSAPGQVIFTDNFNSGASALWGNEVGAWSAAGGTYNATAPNNFPNAHSSLPFSLTDFSVEFDANSVGDGGVWLRSAAAPGTNIGRTGVLLVTGGATGGTGLYWHVVADGSNYGGIINVASGLFPGGSNAHVRVDVVGDTFSAFVNGSLTPATTLTNTLFPAGQVAFYDFSAQNFDNVVVSGVPEPSSMLLLGGVISAVMVRRRRAGR